MSLAIHRAPAKAGAQSEQRTWTAAFAGVLAS